MSSADPANNNPRVITCGCFVWKGRYTQATGVCDGVPARSRSIAYRTETRIPLIVYGLKV